MKNYYLLLLTPLLLIAACSSEQDNSTEEQPKKVQLFKEQTEALKKAKNVEKVLQMGADRKQKIIEEQSQ